jgi:hypothetical protein
VLPIYLVAESKESLNHARIAAVPSLTVMSAAMAGAGISIVGAADGYLCMFLLLLLIAMRWAECHHHPLPESL